MNLSATPRHVSWPCCYLCNRVHIHLVVPWFVVVHGLPFRMSEGDQNAPGRSIASFRATYFNIVPVTLFCSGNDSVLVLSLPERTCEDVSVVTCDLHTVPVRYCGLRLSSFQNGLQQHLTHRPKTCNNIFGYAHFFLPRCGRCARECRIPSSMVTDLKTRPSSWSCSHCGFQQIILSAAAPFSSDSSVIKSIKTGLVFLSMARTCCFG